jgi:hypothetical protein
MWRDVIDGRLTDRRIAAKIEKLPQATCGPVAQLGARFHGMEEVIGSIPIRSTKQPSYIKNVPGGVQALLLPLVWPQWKACAWRHDFAPEIEQGRKPISSLESHDLAHLWRICVIHWIKGATRMLPFVVE